jgi:LacI family transcriptional regulator
VLGVLVTPVATDNPHLDRLAARGTPVVLVDRGAGRQQCSVAVDDVLGGRLAGTHLLERGHRHVAFVGGPFSIKQVADRHAGLQAAVASVNGVARITVITGPSLSVTHGRRAGEEVARLPAARRPTAAFCANDLLALGFLQEMARQRIRVPDDIAIVGYDDIGFAAAAAVPLSSVRQPREELGRAAMELLLDEVEHKDGHTHRQVVLQPDLVVRDSSQPSISTI